MRCKMPDCEERAGGNNGGAYQDYTGYCAKHAPVAKPCVMDGCPNRVASWNRSGCCKEHAHLRHKFKL